MRRLSKAIPIALLLSLVFQGSASAATARVAELDFVFTPDPLKLRPGDSVEWRNQVINFHTTTDDGALALWDSGLMGFRASFTFTFTAGGTYPYRCDLHERFGMFGQVLVRDLVSPPQGPVGTVFTITVASVEAPVDFVYDVQKRNPGGTFQDWMAGITSLSAAFDSTGQPAGVYGFRSRLRRVSDNASAAYSPTASITVTG